MNDKFQIKNKVFEKYGKNTVIIQPYMIDLTKHFIEEEKHHIISSYSKIHNS